MESKKNRIWTDSMRFTLSGIILFWSQSTFCHRPALHPLTGKNAGQWESPWAEIEKTAAHLLKVEKVRWTGRPVSSLVKRCNRLDGWRWWKTENCIAEVVDVSHGRWRRYYSARREWMCVGLTPLVGLLKIKEENSSVTRKMDEEI